MAADDPTADPSLDGLAYADAVAELESILDQLDGDDVDVDRLATQVRRAAELIALCRARLASARMEVTRVVADLGAVPAAGPTGIAGAALDDDADDLDDLGDRDDRGELDDLDDLEGTAT
jgi:exodeoxyribonuclease VII small subunit